MSRQVIQTGKAERNLTKRVPVVDGIGFTTEIDGLEEFHYEVTVDLDRLRKIIFAAAKNTNGTSVRGPLKVRVTNRRKVK
jgi:hypothetical protein